MNWIIENWFLVVAIAAVLGVSVAAAYYFLGMPTEKQKEKVKEWLIWACIEAEKKLQSDTGQLKLRDVYNKFCAVPAFKWCAIIISFDEFSNLVSDALYKVKLMLINNKALAEYVYGKNNAEKEVAKIKEQLGE